MKPYPRLGARDQTPAARPLPAGFDGWFDGPPTATQAKRRYPDAGAAWDAIARVLDGRPNAVRPTTPIRPHPRWAKTWPSRRNPSNARGLVARGGPRERAPLADTAPLRGSSTDPRAA